MRSPSVAMIEKRLNITKKAATLLKAKLSSVKTPRELHDTLKWASSLLGGFGLVYDLPGYIYINQGDTYSTTLMYNEKKKLFFISSMGDVAEKIYLR